MRSAGKILRHTCVHVGVSPTERALAQQPHLTQETHTMKHAHLLATGAAALLISACASNSDSGNTNTGSSALVKCEGINTCKGTSECKSADGKSACQGLNDCAGQGFISVPTEAECTSKGGKVLK